MVASGCSCRDDGRAAGRVLVVALVLVGALVLAAPAAAQQDIAYIDSEYVLEQLPEYATVQQRLDRLTDRWEREITAQEARVDTLQEEFRARELLYTDEDRQLQRQEIEAARREVQQLRQRYFGPEQGQLYRRQQELMRPIQERVLAAVEEIAQAEGYDYVMDKSGPALFLYADDDHDLTDDVLEELGIDVDGEEREAAAPAEDTGETP
jgi:outer membrane protein